MILFHYSFCLLICLFVYINELFFYFWNSIVNSVFALASVFGPLIGVSYKYERL
jgi:hypothetical protein